ncbi:MAG: hypothetical protein V4537_04145 [Pseudomonadota bacterium]
MIGQFLRQAGFARPVRPGYWFAPKRFGFGAVPATVMGWIATAAYLAVLGLAIKAMPTDGARIVIGVCITLAYLAIVWLKTDGGFAWRWGGKA